MFTESNFSNPSNFFQFTLEKGNKKHYCPKCNKKTFVKYIDQSTGSYLPNQFGRCDREEKCNYHLNPYKEGFAKNGVTKVTRISLEKTFKNYNPSNEIVFFDFDTFKYTLETKRYEQNLFIQNLLQNIPYPFGVNTVSKVVELYRLGTIAKGKYSGAITFPFIDQNQKVRAIQVKTFDDDNHTTCTTFLHSILAYHYTKQNKPLPFWLGNYIKQDLKVSCLFGEHLLDKFPNNPIALVEAPKTAIYGALYFGLPSDNIQNPIWLAVYNKSSLTYEKIKVLKGRTVVVYPDLSNTGNTYKEWQQKCNRYKQQLATTKFKFSDILERNATPEQKNNGLDLGDFLIQQDWRKFRPINNQQQQTTTPSNKQATTASKKRAIAQTTEKTKLQSHLVLKVSEFIEINPFLEIFMKRLDLDVISAKQQYCNN